MKKRSRLRKRIRDWLKKRNQLKNDKPVPSFGTSPNHHTQEKKDGAKEIFPNEKPTVE